MHRTEDTNNRLEGVKTSLRELIEWADADYEHATEHDAPETARDDFRRGTDLRKALELVEGCKR